VKSCENLFGKRVNGVGREAQPEGNLFLGVAEEKQSNVARLRFQAGSLATADDRTRKFDQRLLGLSAE
jgi:prophage tail gpP-like protein